MKKITVFFISLVLTTISVSAQKKAKIDWDGIVGLEGGTTKNPLRVGESTVTTGFITKQLLSTDDSGTTSFPFFGKMTVPVHFIENGMETVMNLTFENIPTDIDSWERLCVDYPEPLTVTVVRTIKSKSQVIYRGQL